MSDARSARRKTHCCKTSTSPRQPDRYQYPVDSSDGVIRDFLGNPLGNKFLLESCNTSYFIDRNLRYMNSYA